MEINEKINFLTLKEKTKNKNGKWFAIFKCDCGVEKEIRISAVKSQDTKSCGCHRRKQCKKNSEKVIKHNKTNHYLYQFYHSLKLKSNKDSKKYNETIICDRWINSFQDFYDWCIENGWEKGLVVIGKNKIYSPETCKIIPSSQSKEINRKSTNLKKYGVENYQSLDYIKEKIKKTCIKKYNETNPSLSKEVQEKRKKTCLEKYGEDSHMKTKKYKELFKQKTIDSGQALLVEGKTISEIAETVGMSRSAIVNRYHKLKEPNLINAEKTKTSIEILIESILSKNNINYKFGAKIENWFTDFIIEDHRLIIECDGLYWHSEAKKDKDYHKNKRGCYIKNGYMPLFFYEDEIINKLDIIESIIKNKVGLTKRIFARKCKVKKLDTKTSKEFCEKNHLMGKGSGKGFGLYFEEELICVMRVIKKGNGLDISRFCCKLGYSVIGGFSKLLSYIIKNLSPSFIQTFTDLRYGNGEYLKDLGFNIESESLSFNWIKDNYRFHRLTFTGNTGYKKGFIKLWDCGQRKWLYNV